LVGRQKINKKLIIPKRPPIRSTNLHFRKQLISNWIFIY